MKDSYIFYTNKLQGEYKNAFEQVELYVNSENVDEITREDSLSSFMDMLLSAQDEGKPVQKIIGNDIEKFCKMFCSGMGTKNKILNLLDAIKTVAIIEFIFSIFDILFADRSNGDFWSIISSTNASGYIFAFAVCVVIGYATNFIIRALMFRYKKLNMNLLKCVAYSMSGISFIAAYATLSSDALNFVRCPIWVVLLASGIYLAIYYICNSKRLKENKRNKINLFEALNEQSRLDYDPIMEKRYNTLNKRNIKKGRGELSVAEFLDLEEKDCDKSDKLGWLFYGAPAVLTGIGLLTTEFDSAFDAVFFAVIMLVVQYAVMHFFWKITKSATAEKRAWIARKRAKLKNTDEC